MLLAQSVAGMGGVYATLAFFGPIFLAITVMVVASSVCSYLRKVRERQMASEIVQSMLTNPKNSAEDIERVLVAWWGGKRSAARSAKDFPYRDVVAAGTPPAKARA